MKANMNHVIDNVWVGGDLHYTSSIAAMQVQDILDNGITHILDLRLEWSDEELVDELSEGKISYHWLGTHDHGGKQSPEFWDEGLSIIKDHADEGILVHCHMGVNRAPSLVGLYLCEEKGMTGLEAWVTVKEAREQSWAIYLHDGLHHLGRHDEANELVRHLNALDIGGKVSETIGRIRELENQGIPHNSDSFRRIRELENQGIPNNSDSFKESKK